MRARLERIRPDRDAFLAKLKADRANIYEVIYGFNYLLMEIIMDIRCIDALGCA